MRAGRRGIVRCGWRWAARRLTFATAGGESVRAGGAVMPLPLPLPSALGLGSTSTLPLPQPQRQASPVRLTRGGQNARSCRLEVPNSISILYRVRILIL